MLTTLREFGFGKSSMEEVINTEVEKFRLHLEKDDGSVVCVQVQRGSTESEVIHGRVHMRRRCAGIHNGIMGKHSQMTARTRNINARLVKNDFYCTISQLPLALVICELRCWPTCS